MMTRLFFCVLTVMSVFGLSVSNVCANSAEIPNSLVIMQPAAEVPQQAAAFSGVWSGSWGQLDSKLAIAEIASDGSVTGVYAWGDLREYKISKGRTNVTGSIIGNLLTLNPTEIGAVMTYELGEDGRLEGTFVLNGQKYTGTFTK